MPDCQGPASSEFGSTMEPDLRTTRGSPFFSERFQVTANRNPFQSRSRLLGHPLSGEFQSEVVVYGLAEFLLAAKIAFSCLNGCMPQQKLNLLKFSAR